MSDTATAAALVADLYAAFGRGDIPFMLEQLDDDVSWDEFPAGYTAAEVPHLRPGRGPAHAAAFFGGLADWDVKSFEVISITGDDRIGIARVAIEAELPGGGALRDEELHMWVFGDHGKVVEFRHYVDTAKHIAAARGEDTRTA